MTTTQDTADTCSTREAAELLGISVRTAQLWVEDGRLRAWKTPGGHRRILRHSVQEMLQHRRREVSDFAEFDILIVEDERVQRFLLEKKLAEAAPGIGIRSAANGYEGLIRIGERQPNLLVTDLMMPGIDGFRMLDTLTSSPLAVPMHIIVTTALTAEEIRERGGLPVGVAIFHKPLQFQPLTALVRAYHDVWAMRKGARS